ncbi:MAG: archease [Desulfarculus sp.]|nr:archease [Desulfarculus sp.]
MGSRHGTLTHTADLGLWVEADSLPELMATAVEALSLLMAAGPRQGDIAWLPVDLEGQDHAELLVELLNEVVYCLDGEGLISVALEITELTPVRLAGRLGVVPRGPGHMAGEPVKAVTYHQASVQPRGRGWRAQVIMDV